MKTKIQSILSILVIILGFGTVNYTKADQVGPNTCTPTATKACIDVDEESVTAVRFLNSSGQPQEIVITEETCQLNTRGTRVCDESIVNLEGMSVEVNTRSGNRISVGGDDIFVELLGRRETVNGQPETLLMPIGEGPDGKRSFSVRKRSGDFAMSSRTSSRTGQKESIVQEVITNRGSRRRTQRRNLRHHFTATIADPVNDPGWVGFVINTGTAQVNVMLKNPAPLPGSGGGGSVGSDPNFGRFLADIDGSSFVIELTDPVLVSQARALVSGTTTNQPHFAGDIVTTAVAYNSPWGFHLNPSTIEFFNLGDPGFDVTCDLNPPIVNRNLSDVGGFLSIRFCPLSSRLVREL